MLPSCMCSFFPMNQVSTNIAFKFCHTHIIMWFFIPYADRKFISHKLHSYFSPVSASTGSTATGTFLTLLLCLHPQVLLPLELFLCIQNFVQLLHVNMFSTKATNFVWYLERFNYLPFTESYLKFYPDLVWSKFSPPSGFGPQVQSFQILSAKSSLLPNH